MFTRFLVCTPLERVEGNEWESLGL